MQTFLPFGPDFAASAKALDGRRLGKQRAENIQIIRALLQPGYGWGNHPAVRMWAGYEFLLFKYHRTIVVEWGSRGHVDNGTVDTFATTLLDHKPSALTHSLYIPLWLEDPRLAASHKASLYRKDPEYYAEFSDAVLDSCHPRPYTVLDKMGRKVKKPACDYFWPTHSPDYGE